MRHRPTINYHFIAARVAVVWSHYCDNSEWIGLGMHPGMLPVHRGTMHTQIHMLIHTEG